MDPSVKPVDNRRPVAMSRYVLAAVAQCAHEWYSEMNQIVASRVIWQLDRAEVAPALRDVQPDMFVMLTGDEIAALMQACAWALVELTAKPATMEVLEHRRLIARGVAELAEVRP
jgi:hypothetical protein